MVTCGNDRASGSEGNFSLLFANGPRVRCCKCCVLFVLLLFLSFFLSFFRACARALLSLSRLMFLIVAVLLLLAHNDRAPVVRGTSPCHLSMGLRCVDVWGKA